MRSKVLRSRFRSQVYVTTRDGATFSGLLWEADDKVLVLRNAHSITQDQSVPLDGEVVLRMPNVSFIQRPAT